MTTRVPKDAQDDIDFFPFPTIDPTVPSAEEAPTDGYFASAKTKNPDGTKDLLRYLATAGGAGDLHQGIVRHRRTADLPGRQGRPAPPLVQKGSKLLEDAKEITQFFNRDSSDALQTTADTALTKFLDQARPGRLPSSSDWQRGAQKVWNS